MPIVWVSTCTTNRVPRRVLAWTAISATRDFRDARWTSHRCKRREGSFACSVARPSKGFTALYAELWFKDPGIQVPAGHSGVYSR
jgi:hypothetical protein